MGLASRRIWKLRCRWPTTRTIYFSPDESLCYSLLQRARGHIRVGHAHRPFDCFQPHGLHRRAVPRFWRMAEAGIEDTPFTVVTCPCDGEVFIRAVHARIVQVELAGVEASEHSYAIAREIADLIT